MLLIWVLKYPVSVALRGAVNLPARGGLRQNAKICVLSDLALGR